MHMRVALVSPYSWTHPGGVTRHIEALSAELLAAGHHVRILAPYDGDPAGAPDELISLGRTIGLPFNGAVSNLALTPFSAATLRRELRTGAFDVVHVHEPIAPVPGWLALAVADSPLVGTFHTYTERVAAHAVAALWGSRRNLNRLHVRIAVSEAAAWTARRFIGGEYRIVPNGVVLPHGGAPAPRARRPGEPLEIAFVGQAVTRKGLPVLLRAYEALREHVPARLTVIGAGEGDLAPLLDDTRGVTALGRVDDAEKRAALERAHVLCAPSLGGESFGMVLTEAFAAGTPVVASDIAGYRDVVEHGRDGLLVPPGDAVALGEALHDLALDAPRLERLSVRAGRSAEEYAWPRVAAQVMEAYEDAVAVPAPESATARAAVKLGFRSAAGGPRRPARRLPPLDPRPTRLARAGRLARRAAPLAGVAAAAGGALLAMQRIGWDAVASSVIASSPAWAVLAIALMTASMVLRSVSWHAILKAALPGSRPRFVDALQGTSIGVLMSATLPARLGEPSRALIVARRLGRPRELLPAVLGTLISQTMLNLVALAVLGTVMFQTVGLFAGRQSALVYYAVAPFAVLCCVLVAPGLIRSGRTSRSQRVQGWVVAARSALTQVRSGLAVFRRPKLGIVATLTQLLAWVVQWLACFVLLEGLGLDDQGAGIGAAAAVLFAVNVTAVLPLTPSNLGVFQAACVAVLTSGYHVSAAHALGYGIILQAVEFATAVVMGAPALVKEGVSWREVRLRALHSTPVSLAARRPVHSHTDS
jgi:phosphatidyl-myo-inositol alpha-mannosyltransferase